MASLASMTVKIGADLSDLNKGLTEANKGVQKFGQSVTGNLTAPIRTSTSAMTANAGAVTQAAAGWSKLREPLTSATRQLLQLNPAVSQVSSVLGTMAIGAGPMVGILAGVAALSFAWNQLTKDARENAKATEEAMKHLDELAKKQQQGAFGPTKGAVGMAWDQLLDVTAKIRANNERIGRIEGQSKISNAGEIALADLRASNEALIAEQAKYIDRIRAGNKEIAGITADQGKAESDKQIAADLARLSEALRVLELSKRENPLKDLKLPELMGMGSGSGASIGQIQQEAFDSLKKLGDRSAEQLREAGLELQAAAEAQKAAALQAYALSQATALLSQHGGAVGGILAGGINGFLATGGNPWGAAIGAGAAMLGSLFGGHRKSVDRNTAAVDRLTASMNNEPAGFKVEPYRFTASAPVVINGPITVVASDPWRLVREFGQMQDDYSARGGVVVASG